MEKLGISIGKGIDKETHRKADTGKYRDAVEHLEVGIFGHGGDTCFDRQPRKAENTELLADKKPQHDPHRYRACHLRKGDVSQIDTCIDKGKKGQNKKSHPVVQSVLHLMRHREAVAIGIFGVHRDEKCQCHTCEGSMHTRFEHRDPEDDPDDDVGCLFGDVHAIHRKEEC